MIVATALLFLSTAARADAIGERTSRDLAHPPTANDVIGGLNAFGRFQQGLLESADLKGNEEIRNIAARRAEDAAKRDRTLKQIQTDIGAEPGTGKPPAISGSLVGPDDSEGRPTSGNSTRRRSSNTSPQSACSSAICRLPITTRWAPLRARSCRSCAPSSGASNALSRTSSHAMVRDDAVGSPA